MVKSSKTFASFGKSVSISPDGILYFATDKPLPVFYVYGNNLKAIKKLCIIFQIKYHPKGIYHLGYWLHNDIYKHIREEFNNTFTKYYGDIFEKIG